MSDVEAIAVLHLASWRSAYRGVVSDRFLNELTIESRLTRWEEALSPSHAPHTETIVAVHGDTVLGVCSFGPMRGPGSSATGEIYALHIEPALRRNGIGKLLLDDSLTRLANRGFTRAVLWVLRDNASARRFYEAQGWSTTGEEMVEDQHGYAIRETRYAISFGA